MDRLRTIILSGIWGCRALMRCVEILLSVFVDPTKLDPYFTAIFKSFGDLRRMLKNNDSRYHSFITDMLFFILNNKNAEDKGRHVTGPVNGFLAA